MIGIEKLLKRFNDINKFNITIFKIINIAIPLSKV